MDLGLKKKFQAKPRNKIGLDIGSSAVKMIEVSVKEDSVGLVSLGLKNVSGAVREPLVEAIKSLSEEMKITTKEVNISLSGQSVIVRFVSMPRMRDEELKSAIRFEAEKYIPFAIKDCIVDHQVLKRNDKDNKIDALLVAAKKDHVMDRISVMEECGFTVGVVDVDTFAVANAYLKNFPPQDPNRATALLNIGSTFTNIGIVKDSLLLFSRDIAVNGSDLAQGAKNAATGLLDEMKMSFSYYENQSGRGIDEIYVSGGAAATSLEAVFQEAFESKPIFWDPLKFLDKTASRADAQLLEKRRGAFAVAAGLALR